MFSFARLRRLDVIWPSPQNKTRNSRYDRARPTAQSHRRCTHERGRSAGLPSLNQLIVFLQSTVTVTARRVREGGRVAGPDCDGTPLKCSALKSADYPQRRFPPTSLRVWRETTGRTPRFIAGHTKSADDEGLCGELKGRRYHFILKLGRWLHISPFGECIAVLCTLFIVVKEKRATICFFFAKLDSLILFWITMAMDKRNTIVKKTSKFNVQVIIIITIAVTMRKAFGKVESLSPVTLKLANLTCLLRKDRCTNH